MATEFVRDGQVSFPEARRLWKAAEDGKGVTPVERRTLQYTLDTMKYTQKAERFMRGALGDSERDVPVVPPGFGSMSDFEYGEHAGTTTVEATEEKQVSRDKFGNAQNSVHE